MRIYHTLCILIAFLTGAVLLDGCTNLRNEVDPSQLGFATPKLVINSFLSPQDSILAVKVTRSNTVVGDSISLLQTGSLVSDAKVTISEGGRSVILQYKKKLAPGDSAWLGDTAYYRANASQLPIVMGRTYTLTVETPNGQKASSTCTIPAPVPLTSIRFDSLDENQGRFQSRRYVAFARWQDPAGQANYYQVAGLFRSTPLCPGCPTERSNSAIVYFDDDNRGLFSDAGLDGTLMESGRAYMTSITLSNGQKASFYSQYKSASVTLNLMSIDQSFYRYQEAIIRQRRSRNNPFAEPVLIPSNIDGGLGCFAGYNNATLTLKLK